MPKKTLIVIVGPTAIGKTSLAIELAQLYQTEIISADSRQFFKELSIGTAKPSVEELAAAPHHLINSHSVSQPFSTGDFEVEALRLIEQLFENHNIVVMVGGSGLYINAVCNGLDAMPNINLEIREQLNQQFIAEGIEPIRKKLAELDPEYFEKVDQSNPQRMIRGLEVVLSTGEKLSSFQTSNKKERPFDIVKIGLNSEREKLYHQINQRVDLMLASGLVDEVKSLLPYQHLNALKTVGYSEIFDYLAEHINLQTAVDKIKQNTRRFAKRQLTWFRKDSEIAWFEPNQRKEVVAHLEQSLKK